MNITENIEKFNFETQHINFFSNKTNEDKFICFIFNFSKNLKFIEAGASDGIKNSMTYFLEKELDWTGICVEPGRTYVNCQKNRNCITENVMLGENECEKLFFILNEPDCNDELSCSYDAYLELLKRDSWQRRRLLTGTEIIYPKLVKQVTLNFLIKKHNINHINFLGLDIEDGELNALKGLDLISNKIDVICCENNLVTEYIKKYNYINIKNPFIDQDWNSWYVEKSFFETNVNLHSLIIKDV